MTSEEIEKYINKLNNKEYEDTIFLRKISKNVDVAKVWSEELKENDNIIGNFSSYRFFFIRNEQNSYVGAILDMGLDLHWYVLPENRKKGYLTNALKNVVLPYLFDEGRESQRITVKKTQMGEENYINSKSVALKIGFKPLNEEESEFEFKQSEFNWNYDEVEEINSELSLERFDLLRKRAFYAYKILYKISDELLMAFDDDKGLNCLADEVKKYTWEIEDIQFENIGDSEE